MKKATILILTFIIITYVFSSSFALEENLVLGVRKAQELAVKNNRQLIVDDLEIKTKLNELEKAREDAKVLQYSYGSTDNMLDMKLAREVKPIEANTAYEKAKLNKEKNINKINIDIEKVIYEIIFLEEQLKLEEYRYSVLNERYDILETKYSENLITQKEMDDMKFNIDSKHIDIESVKDLIVSADMKLKNLLSISFEGAPIEVTADIKYMPYKNISIDELVNQAIKNSVEIYELTQNITARETELEIVAEFRNASSKRYDDSNYALGKAKAELDNSKSSIEVNVRNSFNELITLAERVDLAQKYEELLKKKLDIAKLKLDMGISSREEYLTEEQAYNEGVFNTLKAKYNYTMKQLDFQNLIQ